jgi:hypothetical protein
MSNRLLSLLTEIEHAVIAAEAAPAGGRWNTQRLINFNQGLARLTLAVYSVAELGETRGAILLQSFTLADGSLCLKANLSWAGTENTSAYAIYAKPEINWRNEANQIALKWIEGKPALTEAAPSAENFPVESALAATA